MREMEAQCCLLLETNGDIPWKCRKNIIKTFLFQSHFSIYFFFYKVYKNCRIDLGGWRKWLSLFAADRGTGHKNVSPFFWELVHWSGRSQAAWLGLRRQWQLCLVKDDFVIRNLTLETFPSWGLACPPHSLPIGLCNLLLLGWQFDSLGRSHILVPLLESLISSFLFAFSVPCNPTCPM